MTQLILIKVTQGPDKVIVTRSYLHDSGVGQNRETCPTSDPYEEQHSNFKPLGQSSEIETTAHLAHIGSSKQTSQLSTDTETAYESMPKPPSKQTDNHSTFEVNDPTTEIVLQKEPSCSRGGKYNLRPNPNPNCSEIYRY